MAYLRGMTTSNAFAFLVLGLMMISAPALAPAMFPPTGFDGSNARALWLLLMGSLQGALGAGYLIRQHFIPAAVQLFTWHQPETQRPRAVVLRPALRLPVNAPSGERVAA